MRRLFIFLVLLIPWHFVFAKASPTPYCEGHAKKIIDATGEGLLFSAVQAELNRYSASEYDYNGRYELCFDLRIQEIGDVLRLHEGQTLTLTNTSTREVVIGFLNATRTDDTATPILSVHGSKVTIFQPQFSNVKKAIVFDGNRHKLVGGTINGVANAADSLCVEGIGNNIQIKDAAINDCANAISLNGNNNKIKNSVVAITETSHRPVLQDVGESDEAFWQRFNENRLGHVAGNCIFLNGREGRIEGVRVNGCDGDSLKLSGSNHRVTDSQIVGEPVPDSSLDYHSANCLLLQEASNITLESNTLAQCEKGVRIVDSQSIYIGPERFENFAAKKNDIHHNDYAIHAERSQMVYARHNQVYENGFRPYTPEEAYRFGFWPVESNLIFNGESQVLPSPKFVPVEEVPGTSGAPTPEEPGTSSAEEYPVVKYDAQKNAFIDVKVHVATGRIELNFSRVDFGAEEERYQSSVPFADCSFENATEKEPGTSGAPSPEEPGAFSWYLVRCPIQVTSEIKGKRLLAILHGNPVGSSQYAKALGIINDPTGIPVSGPAPTTGNMTGGAGGSSGGSAAELIAQTQGGHVSQGGGGPGGAGGCGGSINPAKPAFPGLLLVLLLSLALRFYSRNSL